MDEVTVLTKLKDKVIEQLKKIPGPIVRVCGPLTTGGLGYEKNAVRLKLAEGILENKGYTVFRFSDAEETIKDMNYSHEGIMNLFHKPILESGLISEAFFLKGWDESKGASIERSICKEIGNIAVTDFPEEWFSNHT